MKSSALDPVLLQRLRSHLGGGSAPPPQPQPNSNGSTAEAAGPEEGRAARARRLARRLVRRSSRPLVSRLVDMTAARVAEHALAATTGLQQQVVDAEVSNELLKGELRALEAAVALGGNDGVAGPAASLAGEVQGLRLGVELLKGELRGLEIRFEDIGLAIAPVAGLAGVPGRFAELRDRVNALDRRLRARPTETVGRAEPSTTASPLASSRPDVDRFDYVGFERRFRGDPSVVLATLTDRYAAVLADHQPVLDVGCGQGELLSVLRDRGVSGQGVDLSADMVAEARAAGLEVAHGDAVAHLRSLPEASLGAIISIHVVEHLQLDDLLELLELAASRLRPGGILVAETPNPASLIVLGNSYVLDPTHVRPLHPSLLTFLCERAGFRDVRLVFYEPALAYHLPRIAPPADAPWAEPLNQAVDQLNDVLFGPQEYAVIATTPP